MGKKTNPLIPGAIIVGGLGVAYYWWTLKDKTPVGLVVTNAVVGSRPLGETSDGTALTAGVVEGTWRADKDSLSVASESAEKPLMVVYEAGTPVHAEVITASEWAESGPSNAPTECYDDDGNEYDDPPQECLDAVLEINNDLIDAWRKLAKDAGATEESISAIFPTEEESSTQEAESIFGPMYSLQSHFVW